MLGLKLQVESAYINYGVRRVRAGVSVMVWVPL